MRPFKPSFSGIATAVLISISATTPGLAQTAETQEKSACSKAFDQCLQACDEEHGDNTAGRAACVPVCSGKFAACDAGVAYEKARPWFEEQAEKTKRLFEDLIEEYGDQDDQPSPEKKTRDNSI